MRGILITIEGINGVGKSTQAMRLKKALECMDYNAVCIRFPNPDTTTGGLILQVLNKMIEMSSEQLHKLFTKHHSEFSAEIAALLKLNFIVIVDHYIWSGLAYAQADGITIETKNIFKPDYTFFLSSKKPLNEKPLTLQRLFETKEKQETIFTNFTIIMNDVPKNRLCIIPATLNKEIIHTMILTKTIKVFDNNSCLNYIKMYDDKYLNVQDLNLFDFDWQKCIEDNNDKEEYDDDDGFII
ncbi:pA240L [African swine fever virus]|nr:pA240L [African swine fever virus]